MEGAVFNLTTSKFDAATQMREDKANASWSGWFTSNFTSNWFGLGSGTDDMNEAVSVATQVPTMNYKGQGLPRSEVDTGTALRVGETWRGKGRQPLQPRPFASTPWMGYGSGVPEQEVDRAANLQFSSHNREPKSVSTITDRVNHYWQAPLIEEKLEEQKDSRNWLIEDASDQSMTRLGIDTRVVQVIKK
jgi:hypothetical protein